MNAWQRLSEEVARWRDAGRTVDFWWRDDDARVWTGELDRLLALSASCGMPLALAVIPEGAEAQWLSVLPRSVDVIQHGADHVNRAAEGGKKTEFPVSEGVEAVGRRLARARISLDAMAGPRFVPALAPPWNRLAPELAPAVAAAGLRGLSQFKPRRSAWPLPGVRQVNTHVDLVAWRAGRGFVGEESALDAALAHLVARRTGQCDADEATGWLTHHARHGAETWAFLERLFEFTHRLPGLRWRAAADLFPE